MSYRVLDYPCRVRSDVDGAAAAIDRHLGRFRATGAGGPAYVLAGPGDDGRYTVHLDGTCIYRARAVEPIVDFVLWHVSAQAIEGVEGCLALHAAAVSWRGRGVLLPAPSGSGKTTLTAALVRAGFRYLTDEAALIDPATGRLRPYPRPLWVKAEGARPAHVAPEDLSGAAVGEPCDVRHVIAPRYRRGGDTRLEPLGRAEAIAELARGAFNLDRFGRRGLEALRRVVAGASCHRLDIGSLDEAVAAVMSVVREPASIPPA